MARITPVLGETLLVKISDGEATPAYAHPALINTTRSVSFTTNVESDELVDLADMSAPAQMVRRVRSTDLKVDGAGMLHATSSQEWVEWALSGAVKNVKIEQQGTGANGGWTITGPFVLTSFQITGQRLKSVEAQITLEVAGAYTKVDNA